jgi:hypothetical protein
MCLFLISVIDSIIYGLNRPNSCNSPPQALPVPHVFMEPEGSRVYSASLSGESKLQPLLLVLSVLQTSVREATRNDHTVFSSYQQTLQIKLLIRMTCVYIVYNKFVWKALSIWASCKAGIPTDRPKLNQQGNACFAPRNNKYHLNPVSSFRDYAHVHNPTIHPLHLHCGKAQSYSFSRTPL